MKNKFKFDDNSQSEWNMGQDFYEGLDDIKKAHVYHFINNNVRESAEYLLQEIDWVGEDIDKRCLSAFRKRIDSILLMVESGKSKTFIKRNITVLKRELWDEELRRDILRPKSRVDNSGKPVSLITDR